MANKYGIQSYPKLIFFHNGKPIQYNGGHTADTIMSWVEEFLKRNFVEENENDAGGFFPEGDLNFFLNINKKSSNQQKQNEALNHC